MATHQGGRDYFVFGYLFFFSRFLVEIFTKYQNKFFHPESSLFSKAMETPSPALGRWESG